MSNDNRFYIKKLPADFLSYKEVVTKLTNALDGTSHVHIVTPYATFWRYAERDNGFQEAWKNADYALPDGIAVLWARKMLDFPYTASFPLRFLQVVGRACVLFILVLLGKLEKVDKFERISGADLVVDLLAYANEHGKRIYILGGWNKSLPVLHKNLKAQFQNLIYQVDEEVANVNVRSDAGMRTLEGSIQRINSFSPDLLIVALGPPVQEKWSYQHKGVLNANVVINAGATIDFLSGTMKRAPKFMRNVGLEWVWRFISQPLRIKRILFAFPYFPYIIILHCLRSQQSSNSAV